MFDIQTEVMLEYFEDIGVELWFISGKKYVDHKFTSEFDLKIWYDNGTIEPGCRHESFDNLMDAVDYINVLRKDKEYQEAHNE